MPTRVSACIICVNEEANIRACLESVRFCDEIVVIDSGSKDRTLEIAREFTDRITVREWPGHIQQKNFAIDAASNDWVLSIDADERVTDELRAAIQAVLQADAPARAGYEVARRTFHLGRFFRFGGWYPDWKLRLFDRRRGRWGGVNPHDHVQLAGGAGVFGRTLGRLRGDLLHYSYRDLRHQIDTVNSFTSIAAKELHARGRGRALVGMLFHPPVAFFRSYVVKMGFREGIPGLIVATVAAFYSFLKHAKLWEERTIRSANPPPASVSGPPGTSAK